MDKFSVHPADAQRQIPGCEQADPPHTPRGRSPYNLYDMAWGSAEWVADWYAPDAYAQAEARDPKGPAEGTLKVQRGGSWSAADASEVRSAARVAMPPDARLLDAGVRCAW